jgi:hypothetical protein
MAQVGKDLAPFGDAHIVALLAPDVAGPAFAVAAIADAGDDAKGQKLGPTEVIVTPVKGEFWQELQHGQGILPSSGYGSPADNGIIIASSAESYHAGPILSRTARSVPVLVRHLLDSWTDAEAANTPHMRFKLQAIDFVLCP